MIQDLTRSPSAVVTVTEEKAPPSRARLDSVDLVRGLVIVVMTLDHVRDFLSSDQLDPMDLTKTYPALFLTRWITHYCAPTFVFLAGTGAFLSGSRGRSKKDLSWFLLTRGLWLVFLEMVVVRFAWTFNFDFAMQGVGVLWAIGWSMVVLAGLVFLPLSAIVVIGISMIAYHNLFDARLAGDAGPLGWLWALTHSGETVGWTFFKDGHWVQWKILAPESAQGFDGFIIGTGYGLIPWAGVMAAGYGLGALLLLDRQTRRPQLLGLGIALTGLFVLLRYTNVYGDRNPWVEQGSWLMTVFSFINCHKYPPSVLYLLMTLGPAITLLGLVDRKPGWPGRFLIVFGRVPLFFYLLHLYVIHGLQIGLAHLRHGGAPREMFNFPPGHSPVENYGYDLGTVYLLWAAVVLFLFPLCYWFGNYKRRHQYAWLSYF
jgi:uncharacterized membrane protein